MIGSKELFEREQQTAAYLDDIAESVERGEEEALKAYYILDTIEKKVKESKSLIKPHALNEANQYDEKTFEHNGLKFERRNGARKWSYKGIPEWEEAEAHKKEIEKECKARFQLYERGQLIASADGEELKIPKVSVSDDSLIVKS